VKDLVDIVLIAEGMINVIKIRELAQT